MTATRMQKLMWNYSCFGFLGRLHLFFPYCLICHPVIKLTFSRHVYAIFHRKCVALLFLISNSFVVENLLPNIPLPFLFPLSALFFYAAFIIIHHIMHYFFLMFIICSSSWNASYIKVVIALFFLQFLLFVVVDGYAASGKVPDTCQIFKLFE